jgi:glycosyltransferase involved in cell wall biosynthesis
MDFWFLCPRINLLQRDGVVCDIPEDTKECALCLRQDKRRYQWLNWLTGGLSNRLVRKLWRSPELLQCMGSADLVRALEERRAFLREQYESANLVLTNSMFLRDTLLARGLRARRFRQLRQGMDAARWVGDSTKTPSPHLRIGYVGQIAGHKGVDVLVQAFQRLQGGDPGPCLTIYGNINQFPGFVRRLRHLAGGDARITFAGTFRNDEILEVHRHLDVLVVPSIWYENSPNVVLEAFVAKTPVIASDRGGLAELVQHEVNGLLFRMGDAADLARQLQRVVDQPTLLASLREGIPPTKTIEDEMGDLLETYRSIVGAAA